MPQVLATDQFWTGALASKTRGLNAKHVTAILIDNLALNKLLIDTLEGVGPVDPAKMFCIGELGDVWLQGAAQLVKKYTLQAIAADGWMAFSPKPENEVEFFEVTESVMEAMGFRIPPVYVIGNWGREIDGVANCQEVSIGDFIARQTYDHADQWVVRRKIWLNSYTTK